MIACLAKLDKLNLKNKLFMVNFFGKNYSTYFASLVRVALKIGNYFHLIDRKINLPPTFCCFQIQGGLICSNVTHQKKIKMQ